MEAAAAGRAVVPVETAVVGMMTVAAVVAAVAAAVVAMVALVAVSAVAAAEAMAMWSTAHGELVAMPR